MTFYPYCRCSCHIRCIEKKVSLIHSGAQGSVKLKARNLTYIPAIWESVITFDPGLNSDTTELLKGSILARFRTNFTTSTDVSKSVIVSLYQLVYIQGTEQTHTAFLFEIMWIYGRVVKD
jgi:hypothetical protein